MNAMDLLNQTQSAYVNSDYGTAESITYNHKLSLASEDIKSFISGSDFNDKDRDKTHNEVTFHNLILSEEPTKLDTILYNSITWKVREWTYSQSMYIVIAENAKRNTVSKREFK